MWLLVIPLMLIICASATADVLNVSLYYESLCSDSRRFITTQLYPSSKIIQDNLSIEFIPFGKAQMQNESGTWNFTCQHGPNECYGNKVQSCVISFGERDPNIKTFEFIYCAMASDDAANNDNLKICAGVSNISWNLIEDCLDSGLADSLLIKNGEITNAALPKLSYIPTIIFNNVYNQTLQNEGEHNFLPTACSLFKEKPSGCL